MAFLSSWTPGHTNHEPEHREPEHRDHHDPCKKRKPKCKPHHPRHHHKKRHKHCG